MFALRIELLTGRYVATSYNDRNQAEWPPHPARFFSALVAAWAEGDRASAEGESELQALHWLERQPAPEIVASRAELAPGRGVVTVFVPVNDITVVNAPDAEKVAEAEAAVRDATNDAQRARAVTALAKAQEKYAANVSKAIGAPGRVSGSDLDAAVAIFPERRTRQARTFPSVAPPSALVSFAWPGVEVPKELESSLDALLARVVRLGHSSSLVHVRRVDAPTVTDGDARYLPDADGRILIRWVAPGQVDRLNAAYDVHREVEPRVLPAVFAAYRQQVGDEQAKPPIARTVFSARSDDWVVLARVGGPRLPTTSVAGVARQVRRALMSFADEPSSEVISGHRSDGAASERPHLAVVPLPNVAHAHADGTMLGIALVLPRDLGADERKAVMRAVGHWEKKARDANGDDAPLELLLGDAGTLELSRVEWGEHKNHGLRPRTWTGPSRRWATATPVALDKNPGDLHDPDPDRRRESFAESTRIVTDAMTRIGLPVPVELDVLRSCVLPGTAKPRGFPRFPVDKDRPQRVLVHVRALFAEPVSGPLLVGAGRFHGLGLFRPLFEENA